LFRFDLDAVKETVIIVKQAADKLDRKGMPAIELSGFTTSPALSAVAEQYSAYLGAHPGSLQVATEAVTKNLEFLHTSMSRLAEALKEQENLAELCFLPGLDLVRLPDGFGRFVMPKRDNVQILDLGYLAPVAATEATTPLPALTAMFAGADGAVIAAADAWAEAGNRMTGVVDALTSARSLLASTTEGEAFDSAQRTMAEIAKQGTIIAMNSTAMGTAMAELAPIRATAHAQLVDMEVDAEARKTAIITAGATNPAAAATTSVALAASEAQTQAEVAAFVSSYLQPALDTARPRVTNLGVEVVGHTGGGALAPGATATRAPGEVVTQVAGGVTTPGQTAAAHSNTTAAQVSPVSTGTAAPSAGTPAPVAQTGGTATAPAGGVTMPAGAVTRPTLTGPYQPTAASGLSLPHAAGTQTSPEPRLAPGPRVGTGAEPTTVSPGHSTGQRPGRVVQPLLPRSVTGGIPGTAPVTGRGTGPVAGPEGTASGTPGRSGGVPMSGGAGAPSGGRTGTSGGGGGNRKTGSRLFNTGQKTLKRDPVNEYFRRQFLGNKPRTVKKVIR
jgi:hypothetical protein